MSKNYKHPKWQKKRLEILERDGWCCVECGEETETLHVHHSYYVDSLELWEHNSRSLFSLCESCHKDIHTDSDEYEGDFHPKYQMLDSNLLYKNIAEALFIYSICDNPSEASSLVDTMYSLAIEAKGSGVDIISRLDALILEIRHGK